MTGISTGIWARICCRNRQESLLLSEYVLFIKGALQAGFLKFLKYEIMEGK